VYTVDLSSLIDFWKFIAHAEVKACSVDQLCSVPIVKSIILLFCEISSR